MLVLAFLFALTAISVSVGLYIYTAWRQAFRDGLFALAFAVLSARAALFLILWHDSDQQNLIADCRNLTAKSPEKPCKSYLNLRYSLT
jgi:hypothetical protein